MTISLLSTSSSSTARALRTAAAALGALALTGSAILLSGQRPAFADSAHPVHNTACASAQYPCITASEDAANGDEVAIDGYVAGSPGQVTLTAKHGTATVLTRTQTSTMMTGDYAGYAHFRFSVSQHDLGGLNDFVDFTASVTRVIAVPFIHQVTYVSNSAEVWSETVPTFALGCHASTNFPDFWNSHADGWDLSGQHLPAGSVLYITLRVAGSSHVLYSSATDGDDPIADATGSFNYHLPIYAFSADGAAGQPPAQYQVSVHAFANGETYQLPPTTYPRVCSIFF